MRGRNIINFTNMFNFADRNLNSSLLFNLIIMTLIISLAIFLSITSAKYFYMILFLFSAVLILATVAKKSIGLFLVLILYSGFATLNVTSIHIGSKTLFLTPGDIGLLLLVIMEGFKLLILIGKTGRIAFRWRNRITTVLVPLIILALLFLGSSFIASTGILGVQVDLARSLLFYFRWLAGLIIFILVIGINISSHGLRKMVLLLAVSLIAGFIAYTLNSQVKITEMPSLMALSPYYRMAGLFPDPNQLGQTCVLLIVILISLSFSKINKSYKLIQLVLVTVLALILFQTQSRESFISLVISIITLWYISAIRRKYLPVIFLTTLLAGSIILALHNPRIKETLMGIQSDQIVEAVNGRDVAWKTSLSIIKTYPLIGIGFENFSTLSGELVWQAHNGFLQAGVVSGVLGLFVYSWLIISIGKVLYHCYLEKVQDENRKAMFSGLLSFYAGYVLTALFSDHFITFYNLNILFWGIVGLSMAAKPNPIMTKKINESSSRPISTI